MNSKVFNFLHYGGLDKDEYNSIVPDIRKENRTSLFIYSVITSVVFAVLVIAATGYETYATVNGTIYLFCCISATVLAFVTHFYLKKNSRLVMPFVYAFMILIYGFSLSLIPKHPDIPAVSAIVFLVVIPLLFVCRPMVVIIFTVVIDTIFCIMTLHFKNRSMGVGDVWNGVTYGLLTLVVGIAISGMRIRSIMQNRKIKTLSSMDLLTGLHNRNEFEQRIEMYNTRGDRDVTCIYGDANGLHELNNTRGHIAGDVMLREVADIFMEQFGEHNSFRIGGDEFVALMTGISEEEIRTKIAIVKKACLKKGHHVSLGFAVMQYNTENVEELVQQAETMMFVDKKEYYRDHHIDRRMIR